MAIASRYHVIRREGKMMNNTPMPKAKPRVALGQISQNTLTAGSSINQPIIATSKSHLSVQPTISLKPSIEDRYEDILTLPESSPERMDIEQFEKVASGSWYFSNPNTFPATPSANDSGTDQQTGALSSLSKWLSHIIFKFFLKVTEAFSEQLNIKDIDAMDSGYPQMCSEYARDIFKYLREMEQGYQVPPTYILKQPVITIKMRRILIDWLIQVHSKFELIQETLYLTVSIIDRYLSARMIKKHELQLVGVTAMLVASKYEEINPPEVMDFVYVTDDTYTSKEIRAMEKEILGCLDYRISNPLCLTFLRRNSKAGEVTLEVHTMAKFLTELCLLEYSMLEFNPSLIAAAALYISIKLYGHSDWNVSLEYYSTYTEMELLPCVSKLANIVCDIYNPREQPSKQHVVKNKYSSKMYLEVAREDCLNGNIVKYLANLNIKTCH